MRGLSVEAYYVPGMDSWTPQVTEYMSSDMTAPGSQGLDSAYPCRREGLSPSLTPVSVQTHFLSPGLCRAWEQLAPVLGTVTLPVSLWKLV